MRILPSTLCAHCVIQCIIMILAMSYRIILEFQTAVSMLKCPIILQQPIDNHVEYL